MRLILILSVLLLASCSSTQKISSNLYMASCDGIWGGCEGEMQKACPEGYSVLAEKKEWLANEIRKYVHFQCTELRGREVSSTEKLLD